MKDQRIQNVLKGPYNQRVHYWCFPSKKQHQQQKLVPLHNKHNSLLITNLATDSWQEVVA